MDYLLSAIDGSSSSVRWTKFVDILNRKGMGCIFTETYEYKATDLYIKCMAQYMFVYFLIIGYQYVAKALSGEEVNSDAYRRYKNLLGPLKMDFVERVNPNHLLCLLESQEKIIEWSDIEHINAEMGNKGAMAGMIVLLDRIWRKSENWYTSFLKVLCLKEYTYFVERLDRQFALGRKKSI